MTLATRPLARQQLARRSARRSALAPLEGGLGPERAPAANSGLWSFTSNGGPSPTQDANGIHFAACNNIASAFYNVALKDNTTYEVRFTMANRTGGGARVLVCGATVNHVGATASRGTDGTSVERVVTSASSTSANLIRIQATGANGTNTFDITDISVKEVL